MGNQPTKHTAARPKKAVHWKSAEPPAPPGKPALVPGTPSSAPDIVTIRWSRPPTDGGSPILGFVVEQRRTGSPHWVRACPSLVQPTELSLSGLEPGWRYQFRVLAENIVGRSESSELSDPLTVTLQRNAISAPRFVHELFDATAVENEKVEFRVQVAGTPAPQIGWFKDGFEIYSSRRARIVTEADASVLVIHQAALTDEGEIKCAATNRAGHSVTRCQLTIDAPPKIRLPRQYEDGLIIAAEEVVRMKVGLAGRPAPAVEWTHNGEPLAGDARHEIATSDRHSTLKLSASRRADRGEYSIRALNKLGEDNASFLVTVTARPEPPGRVTVAFARGRTATLAWAAPEDDGGCEIGNYIVEYYRAEWDVWLKAATCRQLGATLSDLIEGSQYRFRVKAENPYGVSDPSEPSDVLFVADPRRGITDPSKMAPAQPATLPRKRRDPSRSPLRDATDGARPKKAFTPEPYARADVMREMSYGTPLGAGKGYQATPSAPALPAVIITEPAPAPAAAPLAEPESETELNEPPPFEGARGSPRASASLQAMQKFSREPSPLSLRRDPSPLSSAGHSSDPMGSSSINGDGDAQPSQKAAIHNSSEFMLVLYNEQEAKKSSPSGAPLESAAPKAKQQPTPPPPPPWVCWKFRQDAFFLERLLTRRGYPRALAHLPPVRSASKAPAAGEQVAGSRRNGNSTFDFELDELVAPPPPLSLSAPELNVEPPPPPTMRAGVSSTELLYERAMARFYQAVAYEESENQRKEALEREQANGRRHQQPDPEERNTATTTTTTVSNRLASDRRSSLRKRLSGDKESIVKQSSFEQEPAVAPQPPQQQQQPPHQPPHAHSTLVEETIVEEPRNDQREDDGEDDSVSSSLSSMIEEMRRREQQQKLLEQQVAVQSVRRGFMDDDDTDEEPYHPGGQRMRSPYRNPDPSQAIEVLTRPMPLPDPSFVPKPILKRPSTEVLAREDPAARKHTVAPTPQVSETPPPPKPPLPELRTPERERSPAPPKAPPVTVVSPPPEQLQPEPPLEQEPERAETDEEYPLLQKQPPGEQDITRAIVTEAARQRRLESRQNSIEESRAVADFYSDMVQQIESSKKPRKLPLYMSPDEVRKLNEREYSRNSSRGGSRSPLPPDEAYLLHRARTSRSPSLASEHPPSSVLMVHRSSKPARESKILRQRSASIESDVVTSRPPSVARDAPGLVGSPPLTAREENGRIGRPVEKKRAPGPAARNRSRSNSAARPGPGPVAGLKPKPTVAPPPVTANSRMISNKQPTPEPVPQASPSAPQATPKPALEKEPVAAAPTTELLGGAKPTVSYLTDLALFAIACWLYLFKNPKLAIPVILLIMYRHIREALKDRIPAWMRRTEAPTS